MLQEITTSSIEDEINSTGPFTQGIWDIASIPYAIPTAIRKLKNKEYNVGFLEKGEKTKYLLGAGTGSLIDLIKMVGYPFLVFNYDFPEALLLPATTNVISGVYELGRWAVKGLENIKIKSKE